MLGCCRKVPREACGVRHSISDLFKEQLLVLCWRGARGQAGSRRSGDFGSGRQSMYAPNWRPAIEAVNPISAYAAVVKCASDAVMYRCVVEATAFGRLDRRPECVDVPKAVLRTNRERHSDGNGREEDEQAASLVGHVAVSLKLTRIRYLIPRHEAERPRPIWKGPDYPTSSGGPFMRLHGRKGARGIYGALRADISHERPLLFLECASCLHWRCPMFAAVCVSEFGRVLHGARRRPEMMMRWRCSATDSPFLILLVGWAGPVSEIAWNPVLCPMRLFVVLAAWPSGSAGQSLAY